MRNIAWTNVVDGIAYRVKLKSWVPRLVGHDCITLRRTIYCRNRKLHRHTHAHEFAHVMQWVQFGVIGFLVRYLWAQVRYGYKNNPYERDAHRFADTSEAEFATVHHADDMMARP